MIAICSKCSKSFETTEEDACAPGTTCPTCHHRTHRKVQIVAISGSTRFIEQMAVKAWEYEKQGTIALACHLLPASYTDTPHHLAEEQGVADDLDELHLQKIDIADHLHVMNIGGYIGESTRREIHYAKATGKPIIYEEPVKS